MKKFLLTLILLNSSAQAQTIFEKNWTSDFNFFVNDVAIDDGGNAYFACSGTNAAIDSSVSVVVKTNADFEVIWSNWYRTYRRDDLASIEVLTDGNILLGGTMRQDFAFDVGGGLIKINPDGEVIWNRLVPGSFDERVIFTSEAQDASLVSVIRYGVSNQPSSVARYDSEGNLTQLARIFEDDNGIIIDAVVQATDTSFYATGDVLDQELGQRVVFITFFSPNQIFWTRRYIFEESAQPAAISRNANGDLVVTGLIEDPQSVFNGFNALLLRTDSEGNLIDAKRVYRENNGFNEIGSDVQLRDDGSMLVSFNFTTDVGIMPLLLDFNSAGSVNWASALENGESTSSQFRSFLPDGRILLGGRTFEGVVVINALSSDGEAPCNEGDLVYDIEDRTPLVDTTVFEYQFDKGVSISIPLEVIPWTFEENEICSEILSATERSEISVKVFPNPAQGAVFFTVPIGVDQLEVFSPEGKRLFAKELMGENLSLDINGFESGLYLLHFSGSRGSQVRRFIVQ